jgi:hypothetical protein
MQPCQALLGMLRPGLGVGGLTRRACLLSRSSLCQAPGLLGLDGAGVGPRAEPRAVVGGAAAAAYRLGDPGALRPEWCGWSRARAGLISPEGYTYRLGDHRRGIRQCARCAVACAQARAAIWMAAAWVS